MAGLLWGVMLVAAPLVAWVTVVSLLPRLACERYALALDEVAGQALTLHLSGDVSTSEVRAFISSVRDERDGLRDRGSLGSALTALAAWTVRVDTPPLKPRTPSDGSPTTRSWGRWRGGPPRSLPGRRPARRSPGGCWGSGA